MSNHLRSVLGLSRVKKKRPSSSNRPRISLSSPASASDSASASASPSPSPSWPASLPRTKPGSGAKRGKDDADDGPYFHDRLTDAGLVRTMSSGPTPHDIPEAMRQVLTTMFDPAPIEAGAGVAAGMSSTRVALLLQSRAAVPPIVTVAHLQMLMASPTAVEREAAELVRAGTVRRVVLPFRGTVGDTLVLSTAYADMVRRSGGLDERTKMAFLRWLADNPAAQLMPMVGVEGLSPEDVDALVRAGLLTFQNDGRGPPGMHSRPEDRYTMISLDRVSQAASGTLAAVGGSAAVASAGGSGAGGGGSGPLHRTDAFMRVAVPGNGAFTKLISSALAHMTSLLERARHRELPEGELRERWNGGVVGDSLAAQAKVVRGEFVGVRAGGTKRWRDYYGLRFDFVLREAVGAGGVEVFETGSVGRGVRLV